MKFIYGKQDMPTLRRAQEVCFLLPNGLGGFASASAAFSVSRGDQGILVSAETAPSQRIMLVHRLAEKVILGGREFWLSSQEFADKTPEEDGFHRLSSFTYDNRPEWCYDFEGLSIRRELIMAHGKNTTALHYWIENASGEKCTLQISPMVICLPKGACRKRKTKLQFDGEKITCGNYHVYLKTNGTLHHAEDRWEKLYYADDAKDGREKWGMAGSCALVEMTAEPGHTVELELVFSDCSVNTTFRELLDAHEARISEMQHPFRDEMARQLAVSADAYVTRRDSTGGKTIVAGYPFFGDWGRDTMIALPGCTLATGEYETAKSILRTFLAYEKDGLVPNLFPDGNEEPRYNTVDAALLLINTLWLYYQKTQDTDFIAEAWPVLKRIISCYQAGTHHGIRMDSDGLIQAGKGLDQVTWMDVCVDGILPTPRHGKPVEINAYWYNALRVMSEFAAQMGEDGSDYDTLAEQVKDSFIRKFWLEEKGCLRDVLSGTPADNQIRCNQIWAVTMPFTMLPPAQEAKVVETVFRELYTPCGLRTLSPEDPEFHPSYGGSQLQRDLAYHQGTAWVFPLGAYYRAYLKTHRFSQEAAAVVRRQLTGMEAMLREGCVGQLPEIYDGGSPAASKGCFAQAWSVGEMLTVYALLEQIEQEEQ